RKICSLRHVSFLSTQENLSTFTKQVHGSPAVGRDDRAVYVAQRAVKGGKITFSGVSAYANIMKLPLIVNIMSFDGTDVSEETVAIMRSVVTTLSVKP
uniref:hypothetical protein n=1 Tax=Pseudochrobactrum lubricantis TaxID=558172 RepID=UPI0035D586BD